MSVPWLTTGNKFIRGVTGAPGVLLSERAPTGTRDLTHKYRDPRAEPLGPGK